MNYFPATDGRAVGRKAPDGTVGKRERQSSETPARTGMSPATESFTVHFQPKPSPGASGSVPATISTSGWPAGVYFVEVSGADGRCVVGRAAVAHYAGSPVSPLTRRLP